MEALLDWYRSTTLLIGFCSVLVAGAAGLLHLGRLSSHPEQTKMPYFHHFLLMLGLSFLSGLFAFFPGGEEMQLRREMFLGGLLLTGAAMVGWLNAYAPQRDLPEPQPMRWKPLLLAFIGACLIALGFNQLFTTTPSDPLIVSVLGGNRLALAQLAAFALVAAIAEEIIFRGVLFRLFLRLMPHPAAAVVLTAALWAFMHAGVEPILGKHLQIFLLGLIFGWARWRYGIPAAVYLHLGHNALALILFLTSLT